MPTSANSNQWTINPKWIKQKSKEIWIKECDINTTYFHLSTLFTRRNNIWCLQKDDGSWLHNKREIGDHMCLHFDHMFTSINTSDFSLFDSLSTPCIDDSKIFDLYDIAEIKKAL